MHVSYSITLSVYTSILLNVTNIPICDILYFIRGQFCSLLCQKIDSIIVNFLMDIHAKCKMSSCSITRSILYVNITNINLQHNYVHMPDTTSHVNLIVSTVHCQNCVVSCLQNK